MAHPHSPCPPGHNPPQESELTPTGANLLDGRYAVFGYVTEGSSLLKEMQVGAR
jgi:cyclophilin family peptidyl-prolyl cis-trans isomerase